MKGPDPQSRGAVPFLGEHSILETAIKYSMADESPFRKFSGAKPENLQLTDALMANLPGMSEKSIRREYRKLPRAFQRAMSFVYNLGWPAVDLFQLFFGSSCPEGCLFRGAEVLAEEGCSRIRHKTLVNPSKLIYRQQLTERDIDDLLDATKNMAALILALAEHMKKDLRSSSCYLPEDDRLVLENLIFEIQEHQIKSGRNGLRDKILQFYKRVRSAVWNGRQKKKTSAVRVEKQAEGAPANLADKHEAKSAAKARARAETQTQRRRLACEKRLLVKIPACLRPIPEISFDSEEFSFQGIIKRRPRWLKNIQLAKTRTQKAERKTRRKVSPSMQNGVSGWKKAFLKIELTIKTSVPQKDWKEAFEKLSGFEKDVIMFYFAKGKSFSDFSRQKYGTAGGARIAYQNAKRKLHDTLSKL